MNEPCLKSWCVGLRIPHSSHCSVHTKDQMFRPSNKYRVQWRHFWDILWERNNVPPTPWDDEIAAREGRYAQR